MTTTETTGTLVHVDPTTIVLDTNVRTDARLDKGFVASIRENGVMQPVVGYRAEDETVHVLQGQRRTLAAVEAGRGSIPVYLANNPDDAGRIVSQMIENDQRTGFTDAERADGYEQLSLLGMTAGQIARRTHSTKQTVEHGLTARQSDTAREHLASGLTIEQAAAIAEFDEDDDAVSTLLDATKRGAFEHSLSRLRRVPRLGPRRRRRDRTPHQRRHHRPRRDALGLLLRRTRSRSPPPRSRRRRRRAHHLPRSRCHRDRQMEWRRLRRGTLHRLERQRAREHQRRRRKQRPHGR